jgi:hypothetical protein
VSYKHEALTDSRIFYEGVDTRVVVLGGLTVIELASGIISVFDTAGRETAYFSWRNGLL